MKKMIFLIVLILCPFFFYAQTYNPQAAVEYAKYWWDGANTNNWIKDTNNFNIPVGEGYPYEYYKEEGDCANFVSQCLIAGGWDLSEGTDGRGTGLDRRGCIPAVENLRKHLHYKKVPSTSPLYDGLDGKLFHTLGDPVCIWNRGSSMRHAIICTYIKGTNSYYSAHSKAYYRVRRQGYSQMPYSEYFNLTIPPHCFNCDKDGDEEEIDCGGSCPPCVHAPTEKNYTSNTTSLPSETYALEKITAGNASVKVLSGQNVTFITAGEIDLLPGFEVEAEGTFDAQIKTSSTGVTATCGNYCGDEYYPNPLTRYEDYFSAYDLVNVDKIEYEITNLQYGNFVHSDVVYVTKDGIVELWDLSTGEIYFPQLTYYIAEIKLYECHGGYDQYTVKFAVRASNRSLNENENEELEETTFSYPFLSPPINNNYQETNPVPNFFIIPNPNSGAFQLETNFPLSEIGNLKIVNLLGTSVYETQNITSNTFQLQNVPVGQYFVIMMLKDGTTLTQKMMLQR